MSPSSPSRTVQQQAAIETRDVSIGLSAGAGCGKTYVLTERFLSDLEPAAKGSGDPGDRLSRIIAITFTERAAREMRDRIRSACRKRLEERADGELDHWISLIRRIEMARISTIHAFCARLLRRYAVAAGVDPRFQTLVAGLGEALMRATIDRTLRRLIEASDPDCMKLIVYCGFEGTRRALESLLADRAKLDVSRFLVQEGAGFADSWTKAWHETHVPGLVDEFARSEAVEKVRTLLNKHESSNAVMRERRAALLEHLAALRNSPPSAAIALLDEIRELAKVQGAGSKTSWDTEAIYESVKTAFETLRKEIDELRKIRATDDNQTRENAMLSAAAVKVVEAVAADYASAKRQLAYLDFDDLLVKTRDLLRGSREVREEASAAIDALLVDEYQDTDPVQAEIVEWLVGKDAAGGKLFVVADGKQSIYRFRGADPTVFSKLREALPRGGKLSLTKNFRSQPAILDFVNCIFAPVLKEDYEALVPARKQVSSAPAVEFLLAAPADDELDADSALERRRREAEWIAARIGALLADPAPRVAARDLQTGEPVLRPVKAGDIAVLFRALSDVAVYEEVFRRHRIDYYLVGGRAFFAQQEVFDLVNLCLFLDDPDDAVSLVGLLRSPFFSLDDDTLFLLADRGPTLLKSLDSPLADEVSEVQREQVRSAAAVLGELLRKKNRLPLAELLSLAIERTGYDASLLFEFLGRRKVANLRKLIDMARQFDRAGLGTLSDFAQRLRESVREETVEELAATHPETSDVVRLMTVHQAKGLEFPVVIVADADRRSRDARPEAVYDPQFGPLIPQPPFGDEERMHIAIEMRRHREKREEEQESMRVLYVALTRAADLLIISAGLPADRRLQKSWLRLIGGRFELATGLFKNDPYFGSLPKGQAGTKPPEIRVHRHPPKLGRKAVKEGPKLRLGQLRKTVEECDAASWPDSLKPLAASRSSCPYLSVSQIVQADFLSRGAITVSGRDESSSELALGYEEAGLMGTIVHSVVERLESNNEGQVDSLIDFALSVLPVIERSAVPPETVRKHVDAFIRSDVWRDVKSADQGLREMEFLLPWPVQAKPGCESAVITGKLDCLLRIGQSWKLIDYKTGRLPHGDPAALRDKFSIQLALYAIAVRELIGRLPDSIEVVSLGESIRRYPMELWSEFLDPILERIDAAIRKVSREMLAAGPPEPAVAAQARGPL